MDDAVRRECIAAREGVAVMDASTLGKIDIQGPDAAIFLDRIYTNMFSTLPEGQCRYGVMCKADGIVFDDGVTTRLGKKPFFYDRPQQEARHGCWHGWKSGCRLSGPN
jgi:sarcosine oxidase subunit alpha